MHVVQGRAFCVSTGHDLCFAVALLKTWRVYYIFKSGSSRKQVKMILIIVISMYYIIVTNSGGSRTEIEKGVSNNIKQGA